MQNAAAHASAAFSMQVDSTNKYTVKEEPVLVIGGGTVRPVS